MASGEEMGFKFIQQVQQRESRSQNLTKLPATFFHDLAAHIQRLRQLASEEAARDPMSTTANLLQNELKNTLLLAHDIVSIRLRKMAFRAVDSLEGGKVDLRSLTPGEKDHFADLARVLANARDELAPASRPAEAAAPPPEAVPGPGDVPVEGRGEEQEGRAKEGRGQAKEEGGEGTVLVHMVDDVPSFAGDGGMTYSLTKGDLVSLPPRLADLLVQKGMAERVEPEGG